MSRFFVLLVAACGFTLAAAEPPSTSNWTLQVTPPSDKKELMPEDRVYTHDWANPSFEVTTRTDVLTFYPCTQCHDYLETNPEKRVLQPAHDVKLQHGADRYWCYDCHNMDDRSKLHLLDGTSIGLDESYKLCGQCHQAREKDWWHGAHGKRANGWDTEVAVRYNCTYCHNAHQPPYMVRKPAPAPLVRAGLEPMPNHGHEPKLLWEMPTYFFSEERERDD